MTMSPAEQMKRLRRLAPLSWLPNGLFALTLVLLGLGIHAGSEVFFVTGAFSGLAAAASRKAAPHWRNAIEATRTGRRSRGDVSITITRDPTSFDDYVATVQDETQDAWRFEFNPHYWEPREGNYGTEIYYVRGVDWPALLVTEGGIVFPAFTPTRIPQNA